MIRDNQNQKVEKWDLFRVDGAVLRCYWQKKGGESKLELPSSKQGANSNWQVT